MQRKYKVIMIVFVFIIIMVGTVYYFLTPDNSAYIESQNKKIENIGTLEEIYLKDFKIYSKGLKASIKLVVEENKLNSILNSMLDKSNSNIESIYVNLGESDLSVYIPYKIIDLIDTQIEFKAMPKVDKNKFYITINNAKLGKININDNIVSKIIKDNISSTKLKAEKNIIVINEDIINPLNLEDISINKNNIYITANVSINDLIKFIGDNRVKINEANMSLIGENLWSK